MKSDKDILTQIPRHDGMTVPEGYFADFAARMAENLPSIPFEQTKPEKIEIPKRTVWGRLKPYVYMAAMFMGVWCMLKMFTLLTSTSDGLEISSSLAEAINDETFFNEYIINDINQYEIMDDLMEDGVQVADLNLNFVNDDDTDSNGSDSDNIQL